MPGEIFPRCSNRCNELLVLVYQDNRWELVCPWSHSNPAGHRVVNLRPGVNELNWTSFVQESLAAACSHEGVHKRQLAQIETRHPALRGAAGYAVLVISAIAALYRQSAELAGQFQALPPEGVQEACAGGGSS